MFVVVRSYFLFTIYLLNNVKMANIV